MAFVQVDFDAIAKAPSVASIVGSTAANVIGGLVNLWCHCWKEETSTVTPLVIEGLFGLQSPRLVEALVGFGFLAEAEGGFRVKGAERYLRILEAKSDAGKARAGKAKRVGGRFKKDQQSTSRPPAEHQQATSSQPAADQPPPALTQITDHRSQNTERKDSGVAASPLTPSDAAQVLSALAKATGQPDVWESNDFKIVNHSLKSLPLSEHLMAVDGIKLDPWPERPLHVSPGKIFGTLSAVKKFAQLAREGPPKPKVDVRRGLQRSEDQGWTDQNYAKPEDFR